MPRPTNKEQMFVAAQTERAALEKLLDALSPEEMSAPSRATQWSIKDVLAHLLEWEQMCLGWYAAGLRGKTPAVPAEGFNWGQLPALNAQIYEKYRDVPLAQILKQSRASYRQILKTMQGISEADLFTPGRYAWTRKNTLAAYFTSATSSHYVWARKEVRQRLKK
ncbi:MAG: ClbS/DfsB family four-helix bundle protein [Chloroflexi bacterium]|nr:ClbS/DfsB family four-helix bundle protein [Chloroflexota bacterium]